MPGNFLYLSEFLTVSMWLYLRHSHAPSSGNPPVGKGLGHSERTYQSFHRNEIRPVTFKSYQGQSVILVFYPGDCTFICPTELHDLGRLYREFKKLNAEVFGRCTIIRSDVTGKELLRKLHASIFVRENGVIKSVRPDGNQAHNP
jgi:hypothetical protein